MPDRYDILDEIGRGGFGVVYRARDRKLSRTVALKMLREDHLRDEKLKKRFRREAQAVARLDHPHIVPVHDFGLDADTPFLVMPYVDGPTLGARIAATGALSPGETVRVGRQVAEALAYAHDEGVLHRDVKSANVLMDGERPRLTDFGIARLRGATGLTSSGEVMGTPAYMSPEQLEGREVGPRSDVYSLGVVLYECLSGRLPYEGENPVQIIYAMARGEREPLEEVAPEVPSWLTGVVETCLEDDPSHRYEGTEAVGDVLRREAERRRASPGAPTVDMPGGDVPPRPPMPSEAEMAGWPEALKEALRHPETTTKLDIGGSLGEEGALRKAGLTRVPPAIGRLENLKRLYLEDNALTELPPSIGRLENLKKLVLFWNALTELPASLGRLKNLEKLDLDGNDLTELPSWIGRLENLKKLWLWDNDLTELPSSLGWLENLEVLLLNGNDLTELPSWIGRLENLEVVDLRRNDLVELPESLGRLENLRRLDLEGNDLKELPSSLGWLENLEVLSLNGNDLTELPESLGRLENLRRLDLEGNDLKELPSSLGRLRKLTYLDVRDNPLPESAIREIESQLPDAEIKS
jgi:tRNA A-37 threonylcarbamoyl transferase component Bud32